MASAGAQKGRIRDAHTEVTPNQTCHEITSQIPVMETAASTRTETKTFNKRFQCSAQTGEIATQISTSPVIIDSTKDS